MPAEKFDDLIGVKCHKAFRAALKRIAAARGLDDTDLLRAAGYAIVEFAAIYGDGAAVEMTMRMGQSPEARWQPEAAVAEGPATRPDQSDSFGLATLNAAEKAAAAAAQPLMPQGLQGSPTPAGGKRVKKSLRKPGPA